MIKKLTYLFTIFLINLFPYTKVYGEEEKKNELKLPILRRVDKKTNKEDNSDKKEKEQSLEKKDDKTNQDNKQVESETNKPKENIKSEESNISKKANIKNKQEKDKKSDKNLDEKQKNKKQLSPEEEFQLKEDKRIKRIWTNSLLIPGLGQIQNGKVWKTGVIWIGFAGLIGGTIYYHNRYIELDKHKKPKHNTFDRAARNFFGVGIFFWYVLNILDAYVDAHMSTYDISKNLGPDKIPGTEKEQSLKKKRKERKKRLKKKKRKKKRKKRLKK